MRRDWLVLLLVALLGLVTGWLLHRPRPVTQQRPVMTWEVGRDS